VAGGDHSDADYCDSVCLLVVASRLFEDAPLLIGANRDEFLDRPAVSMTVLRPEGPRTLGGQDIRSGGTWLAINEWGVFAGLTNQPREAGRDPSRRTRGELPLALTSAADSPRCVDDFLAHHRPSDYNGSWLLAGDRDSLYFIDFTGSVEARAEPLPPGLYVLENRPLGAPSPKADAVTRALGDLTDSETALTRFRHVLADHTAAEPAGPGKPRSSSNCVHLDGYGTRSSCLIRCAAGAGSAPQIWVADGPPCREPFVDVSGLWAPEMSSPR
jgi:uncharacterized protein with NRDE domain